MPFFKSKAKQQAGGATAPPINDNQANVTQSKSRVVTARLKDVFQAGATKYKQPNQNYQFQGAHGLFMPMSVLNSEVLQQSRGSVIHPDVADGNQVGTTGSRPRGAVRSFMDTLRVGASQSNSATTQHSHSVAASVGLDFNLLPQVRVELPSISFGVTESRVSHSVRDVGAVHYSSDMIPSSRVALPDITTIQQGDASQMTSWALGYGVRLSEIAHQFREFHESRQPRESQIPQQTTYVTTLSESLNNRTDIAINPVFSAGIQYDSVCTMFASLYDDLPPN
ncbi:hypothetical protein AMATHDRAFT_50922 [Amanita thiersii Skay4041]|uniref:Uncharacterized protein n=1 Tax=Amanita thiersii Skay4041 TaxID=703135 RepID=A0A2A9NFV5_9AGAR|nr:hypothetical protein AMATHDRAFT_50922 [Amanita thiersii Skay4041]